MHVAVSEKVHLTDGRRLYDSSSAVLTTRIVKNWKMDFPQKYIIASKRIGQGNQQL